MAAQFNNKDQVIKYFAHTGAKSFKIYSGVKENLTGLPPLFQYKGSAKAAADKLEEILDLLTEGGDTSNSYSLHCFESDESEEKNTNKKSVCTFQFVSSGGSVSAVGAVGSESTRAVKEIYETVLSEKNAEIKEYKQRLVDLEERISSIEAGEDPDDLPEPSASDKLIGAITPLALNLIPLLVDKFMNNGGSGAGSGARSNYDRANVNVNGLPILESPTIADTLDRLSQHVPDLEAKLQKLITMAEENPEQFKMLLNFL